MKQTFRSKIGPEIIIPVGVLIGGLFIVLLITKAWAGLIVISCLIVFITHMFATTYYIIDGNELKVRCGFIINLTIDINKITKIVPTRSILSSPAVSLDRLEIFYNKYDSVLVSPKDKAGFIAGLKGVNERIVNL
jgi:Bacterial PH domain